MNKKMKMKIIIIDWMDFRLAAVGLSAWPR